MNYKLFQLQKKLNLEKLTGEEALHLPDVFTFSLDNRHIKEGLQHEELPKLSEKAYETLIPIGDAIVVRVFPRKTINKTPARNEFQDVTVPGGQGIIISSGCYHWVKKARECDRVLILSFGQKRRPLL